MKLNFIRPAIIFPALIAALAVILCWLNYTPGTFLSGWDTIHPEFNFPEYFKRVLSVWQEHQGLGAPPSQAHAAELPRLIFYYLASLMLPMNFLRYGYFFLSLIVGPLGVYFSLKENISFAKIKSLSVEVAAFSGGVLYLLNLATLQHYQVPLEMFATHYAVLGWLFLLATRFINLGHKKILLGFFGVLVLGAAMAHTPTLFYVFFGVFSLYLIFYAVMLTLKQAQRNRLFVTRAVMSILLMVLANLYWILPNIYYVRNYGNGVVSSKINVQFSDRAFLVGQNFANPRDTALLKNFIFDWGEYDDKSGLFIHVLDRWQKHFDDPKVNLVGYSVFLLVLIGLGYALWKRQLVGLAFLPVFVLPFLFIANDNPLFQLWFNFLQDHLSVAREALRFPYTKFSILLLFSYCFYFALALFYINESLAKLLREGRLLKLVKMLMAALITAGLIFYMWPAFTGNLINDKMKVRIPAEYFQMFDWFKTQPLGRIVQFPVNTFWAWSYYNFDYEGAGFLWFGLSQPLMNREFDRWIPDNENYYWEISYAVYSRNLPQLENVLNKYQIQWLLVDANAIDASSAKSPYYDEFKELISKSDKISLSQRFGSIAIYQFKLDRPASMFVSVFDNLPRVGPKYTWNNNDIAYGNGDYVAVSDAKDEVKPDVYYPFRSLFSNRSQQEHEYTVEDHGDYYLFKKTIPPKLADYQLVTPDPSSQLVRWFDDKRLDIGGYFIPQTSYVDGLLQVVVPKVKGYFSVDLDPAAQISKLNLKNCDYLSASKKGRTQNDLTLKVVQDQGQDVLQVSSVLGDNCSAEFLLPSLPNKFGYLISVESRNVKNKTILFWLENINAHRSDLENYLPKSAELTTSYFIQPPMEEYAEGYFLHFDNWSFNRTQSVNDLGKITVYPIPYNYLTEIRLQPKQGELPQGQQERLEAVEHPIQSFYRVKLGNSRPGERTLALYQSFDFGWQALAVEGWKINSLVKHSLVDNWANGWRIDSGVGKNGWVIIFFMPQLLQYFGYVVLLGLVVWFFQGWKWMRRLLSVIFSRRS